jgi:hypothetical protein
MKQSENRKRKHHASKYQEPVHKRSFHSGSGSSGFHKSGGNHHNNNVEMGISTTREMATTIMAIGVTTITTPQGQMAIIMATTMAETTMPLRRRILVRSNALSATRLGIMLMIAHRRRRNETNQIHFRRGMSTMSMWRRFMMSLTPFMVHFSSMIFQHLFFLILVHLIHSYQEYLWVKITYQAEP